MRPRLGLFLAACAITVLPISAKAESDLYITLQGGLNLLSDSSISSSVGDAVGGASEAEFRSGFTVGGALGSIYRFRGNAGREFRLRPELDLSYRSNNVDSFTFTTADGQSVSMSGVGDVSALSGLANVWVDAPQLGAVRPYAGGGIGISHIKLDDTGVRADGFDFSFANDSDNVFTWQLGAGVGIELTQEMSLGVDYRWLMTQDPEFSDSTGSAFDSEFSSHSFMGSIRYNF